MAKNPVVAFGEWVAGTPADWPAAALKSAHLEFIDTVGVMVPGAVEPVTRNVLSVVSAWGSGPATAVGASASLAAPWAALVNGTAGHALDFDDNFDPPKAHASTVLVPAILALGEQLQASGAACLDAYIVGLQIMGRVGQGVNPYHRNRGWHATATVGALGAAAACARLLKLDAQKAGFAISIATSMSAGFMSQFGTMTKPVHAGLAAKAGVMAAALAQSGVTAGLNTLDGPTGMNHLMVGPDYETLRDNLTNFEHGQNLRFETENVGTPLLILEHGFRVKRFPNCGSAHRAMDGLMEIKEQHNLTPDMVERVEVMAPKVHLNNLMYADPQDGLQGKFSMPYGLSLILATGNATLADFTDEAVKRPEVRKLYALMHLTAVDKPESEFPTRVKVILKDGREFEEVVAMPRGSKPAPFTEAQYWQKFDGCVKGLLSEGDASAVKAALQKLPSLAAINDVMNHLKRIG